MTRGWNYLMPQWIYQVLQEGDYYQDPSVPAEQPTWQYAVVPPAFQFPAGVQYQTLAQIHIPGDNYTAVETEAERLAALQDGGGGALSAVVHPNTPQCPDGYHWDFATNTCVSCPDGYTWDGRTCALNPPPPPPNPNPPAPAPDAAVPAGSITVFDTQLPGTAGNHLFPLRNVRIVAKRWFKIERTYTDNNGHFQCTKRFKHKVKIKVKFKNNDAFVRSMRGFRLWQILLPFNKTTGVYSGDKSNIVYNFPQFPNSGSGAKGNRYWSASTVFNAVQEYKDYATQEGIGLPRSGLKILMTNLAGFGSGSSPMFNKRWFSNLPQEFLFYNVVGIASPLAARIAVVLQHEIDVTISYSSPTAFYGDLHSDHLKEQIYHELTHTAHYAALGSGWYGQFVNAEINEIISTINSSKSPYGASNTSDAPIIAVGESWAYYMGHYFADKRYGLFSSQPLSEQPNKPFTNNTITGVSSHINVLEGFDPHYTPDPFYWIPQGVYEDLIDVTLETVPVLDQVSGYYTNQKLFNAFGSSIISVQGYKNNLLQQNSNNQSTQVINLFQQYAY